MSISNLYGRRLDNQGVKPDYPVELDKLNPLTEGILDYLFVTDKTFVTNKLQAYPSTVTPADWSLIWHPQHGALLNGANTSAITWPAVSGTTSNGGHYSVLAVYGGTNAYSVTAVQLRATSNAQSVGVRPTSETTFVYNNGASYFSPTLGIQTNDVNIVGFTYDGANVKKFFNGRLVDTDAETGDGSTGSNNQWMVHQAAIVGYFVHWNDRAITDDDMISLTRDPYQLLKPKYQRLPVHSMSAPDTTAPILSLPTGTSTGSTTGSGTVSTDEGNGTLYYYASTNSTETAATIKASGDSQAVSASGVQNVTFTGLTPSTAYYAHYVHDDAATNESNVVSSTSFTTDAASGTILPLMMSYT